MGRSCAPRVTYAMDLQDLQNIFTDEYNEEDEDQDISDFSDDGSNPNLNSILDCLRKITPQSQMSPDEVEVEPLFF